LDLYDNRISKIENIPSDVKNLDLSFNLIRHIENIESLNSLENLYLVQNKIKEIGILKKKDLKMLELGGNRIGSIGDDLNGCPNLCELYLGQNKISRIEGLNHLVNLKIISLQSNRITKIEGLDCLVNLEELYLSHNGIQVMEGLKKNEKLKILDLGNNRIEKLENLQTQTNLEELWLNHNIFSSFDDIEKELKNMPKLQTVYFEGNPVASDAQYRLKLKLFLPSIIQIDATLIRDGIKE